MELNRRLLADGFVVPKIIVSCLAYGTARRRVPAGSLIDCLKTALPSERCG
jgi:hypothetical protein